MIIKLDIPDRLVYMCTVFFVAITCTRLILPTNGIISYATDITAPFDYRATATYSCDPGYGLSGGDTVRTCFDSPDGVGGEWTGTAPICRGIHIHT